MIHDQPGTPLSGQVSPNPLQEDAQTETRRRQELKMHGRPCKPRSETAYMDFAALQYRKAFTHNSHVAFVKLVEWTWRGFACYAVVNKLPCITALLHCHLCHTRQWCAVLIERCGVANNKYFGMSGHSQVVLDAHAPGSICFHLQPFARKRGRHSRGPDHGFGRDAVARHRDAVSVDLIGAMSEPDLNAQLVEPLLRRLGQVL